ncbi:MAG: 50S ribosomal protein L18 [Gammaproteobacteria bacterium]|nr:50S ribosomal protein L18 [Gammaproteobacteria bacterium]
MNKKQNRLRRAQKTRARIRSQGVNRLCVHRTPRHIYAQLIDPDGGRVVASASTLDAEVKLHIKYAGNVSAATVVGKVIADRARKIGVNKVAFDRSGFKFHGRVKALADAARENGMEF